jgi:hypothetical protein
LWQNPGQLDLSRLLLAVGLSIWLGALAASGIYLSRRMHFPRSNYAKAGAGSSPWLGAIAGSLVFAWTAYSAPMVAWVFTLFTTGLVIFAMGVNVVALNFERRRATRLELPEPGTEGTRSFAEFAVFLAIAVPFALTALALTVYGIANEIGGNRGEGGAGLALGACAGFIAFVMGLFGSPLLALRFGR